MLFSTRNTRLLRITCLKSSLNSVLNKLVLTNNFQFRIVSNDLVEQLVVNNDLVNKLRSLISKINSLLAGQEREFKPVSVKLLDYNSLIDRFNHSHSIKELLITRELAQSLLELELLHRFVGVSGGLALIEGYAPKSKVKSIINELSDCVVEVVESSDSPVIINNNGLFKPFELITRLYSAPRYGDVDPTPILALTFMFCFGLMTSDLINGLLLMSVGLIGYKRGSVFKLTLLLGLSSTIFGLIFGEALGGLIPLTPLWFSPFHEPLKLLYLAIGFGLTHLIIGHFIGLINVKNSDGWFKAVTSHLSFILLLLGVLFLLFNTHYGYYLVISGLFLLFIGHNISDLVELPSLIGNVISYSRLLAINMAHVGIAKAFAMLGLSLNPFIGWLLILFGEVILLTLGLIVALVHSLRLHFVEFFTKFMRPGQWFNPYVSIRKYTIT